MRKTINTLALLTFIWLLLDALRIPTLVLNFLLAGELPFVGVAIPPSSMLILLSAIGGLIVLELLIRRLNLERRTRSLIAKRERLPKRRFERV